MQDANLQVVLNLYIKARAAGRVVPYRVDRVRASCLKALNATWLLPQQAQCSSARKSMYDSIA